MVTSFLEMSFADKLAVIMTVFVGRTLLFAGVGSLFTQLSRWARKLRIIERDIPWRKIGYDVAHAAKILAIDGLVVAAALHFGFLKTIEKATPARFAITFGALFVWMEVYFYYSHRLLHHPKLFWIHRHHHEGNVTNPWTSLSFSVAERLILLVGSVALPGLVSWYLPLSLKGYSAYFFTNYVLNVNGHLNVELFPRSLVLGPVGEAINTATYHSLHHSRYRGHFGLFSRILDRAHGTEFADYKKIYLEVTARAPVASA